MNHILILGGDGYLGWPTAMYFSIRGYKVTVVDNYFRRDVVSDFDIQMLYKTPSLTKKAEIWYKKTGFEIKVVIGDLVDPVVMRSLFTGRGLRYQWSVDNAFTGVPEVVVHYAEQPSAPYSMMNYKTANFTLSNNILVTNNLMFSVKDLSTETHIIKLGTMGEYGTPNIDIEEGWINIQHKGREDKFLYPRQAGSMYHTSKIMDTDLMWFGCRMWGLRVTDLMQGPVYGIETEESKIDSQLKTIFNYDELFGTVINRFIAQAVSGYPLTVYGKGGQTRGYLNIIDTLQCIHAAVKNPPNAGNLNIYNQIMETFTVNELAALTQQAGNELGYKVKIKSVENPRVELENHYYNPTYQSLKELGISPNLLTLETMKGMLESVEFYKKNINTNLFNMNVKW